MEFQTKEKEECKVFDYNLKDMNCESSDDCRGYRVCRYSPDDEKSYCRG